MTPAIRIFCVAVAAFAAGILVRSFLWLDGDAASTAVHASTTSKGPVERLRLHGGDLLCDILAGAPEATREQLIYFAWTALGETPHLGMTAEEVERFEYRYSDLTLESLRSVICERAKYGTPSEQVVVMGVVSFVANTLRPQVTSGDLPQPAMTQILGGRLPDDKNLRAKIDAMEPRRQQKIAEIYEAYEYFIRECETQLDWRFWAGQKVNVET